MKLYSIQFLRAIAAILVVYCHSIDLQVKYATSYQQNIYHLQDFGAIGVDIFFVISGFIISFIGQNLSGPHDTYQFLKKRFIRINPAYYFFSAIAFVLLLIENNFLFTYKSVVKTLFILPIEPGAKVWWPVLGIGWTLSFEWFFYLIFSVIVYTRVKYKELFLVGALFVLVALGVMVNTSYVAFKFITHPIILEFGAGAVIGWLFKNKKINSALAAVCLIASIAMFVALVVFGYKNVSESNEVLTGAATFSRFFYFGIPSILLVFGCLFLEDNKSISKIWKNNLFQLLGDASYSIYLVHTLVFIVLGFIYNKTGLPVYPDLAIIIQVAIAVMIGIYCHLYIEKRILRIVNRALESISLISEKKYYYKAR